MIDGKQGYFQTALSDFMFDVAAGGAIRHLVDRGHSVEQIMKELDYPVPRAKVEKAVYRYLLESGILLPELPDGEGEVRACFLREKERTKVPQALLKCISENGEENCYMKCPFGLWMKQDGEKLRQITSCLTSREQEYILGIQWERNIMYHRLNSRMREIGTKLVLNTEEEWEFYYFISES